MGKLLLVGCGKMGGAMLEGWLARGLAPADVIVAEPVEGLRPRKPGLRTVASTAEVSETPGIVVLAVKPQTMDAVLPDLRRFADEGAVFLSIAAGKTLSYFARHLGTTAKVVRAMPNTPAAVRQGISVAAAADGVSATEKARCQELLEAVGQALWVEDEALMDPVTALSGSGPAYVFLLVEAMAAAGAKLGLAPDMAMQLARATVAGSGELLRRSTEPAAQLRVNVTSPGGTTAEALKVLMAADGLQPIFDKALAAASRRSKELAG
ncbi:pyrroline-5-carboxylate reductase [Enhydrobacter sp.]|jgi:pyrroline-5-carboxylate reductase|uniref:pyrroline-5-carboxylate reductase n=1 Tax=Enhydrobacter sp. TaxID=1894999 RepID=UPI0026128501|nr:pyrroline-5-carboxylate reductase [Enhydrobacter sp.]WIM10441.1 MAG: Pyrroline-5-carboxylate reductase [Enhydrobacter sp.]